MDEEVTAKHLPVLSAYRMEPQKAFDWVFVQGSELLKLVIESMERPQVHRPEHVSLYQNITATYRQLVDVDVIGELEQWREEGGRHVEIVLVDAEGAAVEKYVSDNARVRTISPEPVDYKSSDVARVKVEIQGTWKRVREAGK